MYHYIVTNEVCLGLSGFKDFVYVESIALAVSSAGPNVSELPLAIVLYVLVGAAPCRRGDNSARLMSPQQLLFVLMFDE